MTARYRLRYMNLQDVPQVVEIDNLSFPMPWSSRSYLFEITDNKSSHMIVLDAVPDPIMAGGFRRILHRLGRKSTIPAPIVGYGGFWHIEGEAHISTIAVHPDYRGRSFGEVLLAGMMGRSLDFNAEYAVLEVRVSNTSAINLYQKYEFQVVGRRKNYYRDNNEDAFLMHADPLDSAYRTRFAERVKKLHERVSYENLLLTQGSNETQPE